MGQSRAWRKGVFGDERMQRQGSLEQSVIGRLPRPKLSRCLTQPRLRCYFKVACAADLSSTLTTLQSINTLSDRICTTP